VVFDISFQKATPALINEIFIWNSIALFQKEIAFEGESANNLISYLIIRDERYRKCSSNIPNGLMFFRKKGEMSESPKAEKSHLIYRQINRHVVHLFKLTAQR
jgi:hypothetical protein